MKMFDRRFVFGLLITVTIRGVGRCERHDAKGSDLEDASRSLNEIKQEPTGFQFRALLFDTSTESKDAFYDELTEPLALLKGQTTQPGEAFVEKIESMILIKLKIVNRGKTTTGLSYLCIDHVYDRKKGTVYKLLNTIVFKIKQEQISLVYDLSFLQVVNGLPQEEIINKNRAGFKGCTTEGKYPTCGHVSFNNLTVPFSEGFCCSCDPNVNKEREKQLIDLCIESEKNKYYNISLDGNVNLKYLPVEGGGTSDKLEVLQKIGLKIHKRTIEKTGIQTRGGQSCIDRTYPKGVDPVKYHESAHCLRFSKMWYNAYKLLEPKLENIIVLQMYRKRHPERAASNWIEITKATPSILGSSFRSFSSDRYQILFTYADRGNQVLDEQKIKGNKYLLKPRVEHKNLHQPFAKGGAKEYLLVDSKLFDFDGGSCNKIGVSFMAFSKQKNRCGESKGACLCNQPYALWLHDKKRHRKGTQGNYMLRNFAIVSEENSKNSLNEERLHLDFHGDHVTRISVGIDNFVNNVISTNPYGIVSEIYIDAANEYSTSFIINMINDGLLESTYRVALANLPEPLPKVWRATPSKPFNIAAHNGYSIRLQMYGKLPIEKFHVTVQLQTADGELISSRRATVQNNDRCYCVWECECACEGSEMGLRCKVLDQRSYSKAGYQGAPPPRRPSTVPRSKREHMIDRHRGLFIILANIFIVSMILLAMGVVLAIIRGLAYVMAYSFSYRRNRPYWRYFRFKLFDGALIPLFICNNKPRMVNSVLLNIFYFWLVPLAFLCFVFHLLTLKTEIFGRKEVRGIPSTTTKKKSSYWDTDKEMSKEQQQQQPQPQPQPQPQEQRTWIPRQQQTEYRDQPEKRVQAPQKPLPIKEVNRGSSEEIQPPPPPPKQKVEAEKEEEYDDVDLALKSKSLWLDNQRRKYNRK